MASLKAEMKVLAASTMAESSSATETVTDWVLAALAVMVTPSMRLEKLLVVLVARMAVAGSSDPKKMRALSPRVTVVRPRSAPSEERMNRPASPVSEEVSRRRKGDAPLLSRTTEARTRTLAALILVTSWSRF